MWIFVRLIKIIALLALLTIIGLILGVMVVIMPPLVWIGLIGFAGVVLLWVMPDLPHNPESLLRRMFIIATIAQLSVPSYYAYAVPGLPWISIRRLTWFPTLLLAALTLATVASARARFVGLLGAVKPVSIPLIGFFVWIIFSLFTSISPKDTFGALTETALYWVMAFVTATMCVRNEDDVRKMLLILCALPLVAGPMGLAEYLLQRHFIYTFWPESWIQELFAKNTNLLNNITRDAFRNGEFRVNYIYNVALSYAEFMAILSPIAVFFAFHGRQRWIQIFAVVSTLCCLIGIWCSGSRGGFTSFAASVPLVVAFWIIRRMRERPDSMVGALASAVFVTGMAGFITLAIGYGPVRKLFTGGGEGQGSTDVRWLQWNMALPSIAENPVTGYGHGVGGVVVGYVTPGGTPTVDSYIITLLVDAGVPALLFFFTSLIAAVVLLLRAYLRDPNGEADSALATATAIVSFGVYRIALSQNENHFLYFMLLGVAVVQIAASRARLAKRAAVPAHPAPNLAQQGAPDAWKPAFQFPAASRRD